MSEYVWPAVAAFVALLAYLRFRPPPPVVKLKRVRLLEHKVKKLEADLAQSKVDAAAEMDKRREGLKDEIAKLLASETSEMLQKFADDMMEVKQEFSTIKKAAHFRDVVEGTKKAAVG